MTPVDWIIVGALTLSVVVAAANGFTYELFSLAGVVVGYLVAAWGYHRVAAWYAPLLKSPATADIAGFLTILFAVILLAGVVARIARWAMNAVGLRWFDRLLGGAFGLVRGGLTIAFVLLAVTAFAPRTEWLSNSEIAPYLLVGARAAVWAAPGDVRARFHDGITTLRGLRLAHDQAAVVKK